MVARIFALSCVAVSARFTPQGERHESCVVEVPHGVTVVPVVDGIELHHDNGTVAKTVTPEHCHTDNVAMQMTGKIQPNQWIDHASIYPSGVSKMTGYNNIPDAPRRSPNTDYYFLGLQNMKGPINILQPVLTYRGQEWTAASWICCPANITTTGPSIGPFQEGDRMYGAMTRVDDSTWQVDTVINGQTSTLKQRVGAYNYDNAVVTFEEYGADACDQLPQKPITFDTIEMLDNEGQPLQFDSWQVTGPTYCSGSTTSPDKGTVVIQHGSASDLVV